MHPIRRAALVLAVVSCGFAGRAVAQDRDEARARDIQRLQEELQNLDAELNDLEPGDRKTEEFRERAEEIREEAIYIKVKMRRHARRSGEGTGVDYDEVEDLRRSIADLREDVERSFDRRDERDARLTEGTEIQVRLDEPLSSRTARREDRFEATVFRPVRAGNRTALPAGTRVRGVVRDAEPAQRPSRSGRLELSFDSIYVDRSRLDLKASVVSVSADGEDRPGTAEKAGIGAVLGGVLGGILGGKKGALVGVIVGGGGAVAATKGDDVELPAGTIVTLRLDRPLEVPRD